jgi:PPOX class probable F420-dependent enzyme
MPDVTLPAAAKALIDARTFPTLATINTDGSPQLTVHWVTRDGDDILLSTVKGRQKERNLRRDPRAALLLLDPDDDQHYVEVRGTITMTEAGGRELIDDLNEKYSGDRPFVGDAPDVVRVVLRLKPERVIVRG